MKKPAAKAPVKGPGGGGAAGHGGGTGGGGAGKTPAAGKHQAKAKAKPAKVSRAVHRARHAAAVKASKTRAANAKKANAHPRRQLALGSAVACCSAEALAASLRLAGWPVADEDVLALYWHTARDEHAGASILATLEAAAEFGLAGVRLARCEAVNVSDEVHIADAAALADLDAGQRAIRDHLVNAPAGDTQFVGGFFNGEQQGCSGHAVTVPDRSVILGLSLPAPHAVLDTGSEWISWGQAWPVSAFPDVATEEAWAVDWEGRQGS